MFCHQEGLCFIHTEWFCGSNRGAQVCFHVYNQYTNVLLLVWLGKLSQRTKLIPLNTCLMASLQLPSQTVTKHACSRQDQSECSFTASEHIRDALHDLCLYYALYDYVFIPICTHSRSYFCLYFVIYPWVSDCITPLKRIKAATHTHTLTKTHSSTHTNSSPCHCITTHAQALVNPSPFIMHHEHTPLQAQKRRSHSAWHCFFKVVQVKGVRCKIKCNKINIEVA